MERTRIERLLRKLAGAKVPGTPAWAEVVARSEQLLRGPWQDLVGVDVGQHSIHVAHLVRSGRRIVRLDPAGRHLAAQAGFRWSRGDVADAASMVRVAEWMAEAILASVSERSFPAEVQSLFLTEPLPGLDGIDGVMFSGGVAEYVYRRETREFGDMGLLLGRALRRKVDAGALPWPLLPPGECIRATALGASEYSVQLSGNTTYISNPGELLPRKNLQVLQPSYVCEEHIDPKRLADAIAEHFKAFDLIEGDSETALALRWEGIPSYERIAAFALGIRKGLAKTLAKGMPLYIMIDGDIAQTLGAILRDEMGVESEILVIDGVILWDFDYIDLGRIRMPSQTVPVTVKSLVFSEDPRSPRGRAHRHGHERHGHHQVPPG